MVKIIRRAFIASLLALSFITLSWLARETSASSPASVHQEASSALQKGRQLLRRYASDQAFTQFQLALKLFTAQGERHGLAATHDALGDLYALNGQEAVALDYYRRAYETFRQLGDTSNANAMLTKIGERHFLRGDATQARAAFAAMMTTPPEKALHGEATLAKTAAEQASDDQSKKRLVAGGVAALAALSSCLKPLGSELVNQDPKNPPHQGRAPNTPNGVGRMDLRITDEQGNPLGGVRAQIQSTRPGGFYCECWETTTAYGRALMPPLHIANKIKLVLKAPGLPTQQLVMAASELAQPVNVVLSKAGARLANSAVAPIVNQASALCFNFYRALVAFAASELGMARADFANGRLAEARQRYENLLAQLAIPGVTNFKHLPRLITAARTALGDIAFREGRFAEAVKLYTEARDGAQKERRLDLMWAAQRGLGRTLWEQSSQVAETGQIMRLRNESLLAYRAALKSIETIRAGSLRADEARTTFLANTKDVYDEAAAVLTEMAFMAAPAGVSAEANVKAVPFSGSTLSFAASALAVIEMGRARSLLELLGEAQAGITEGVPADLLQRLQEITDRQQEIAQMLMGVTLPGALPPEKISALEAELDKLTIEADGLENTMRTSSPRYASLAGSQPLSLSDVQQKVLDDDTALLLYSLSASKSYLWVITRTSVAVARLPGRPDIEAQVMNLRAQLIPEKLRRAIVGIDVATDATRGLTLAAETQPVLNAQAASQANQPAKGAPGTPAPLASNVASYARAAQDLFKTVLQPAAHLLGDKRLLVVADGALNYVPFEALVTAPPGDAPDYAALAYLVKTHEIVYAPSASVINAVRQQAQQVRKSSATTAPGIGGPVLIVADPVFSSADVRAQAAGTTPAQAVEAETRQLTLESALNAVSAKPLAVTDKMNIVRLASTRTEANEIAQLTRSAQGTADVWLDLEASKTKVLSQDLSRYRVLHFATHGLLNAEHPQFSGLVLSLVGETKGDGFLRVKEVFNLRIGAPLVILSACETGLGREKRGEGIIGLTRAFMYAGAPTVGASLWAVADRSTAQLMTDFYQRLLANRGALPSHALRAAQLKMIAIPRYSAPYYWAPFVMIGDWS